MFKDTDEALRRLEEALLEDEIPQDETEEQDEDLLEDETLDQLLADTGPARGRMIYQNFSNDYGRGLRNYASGYHAYNTDTCDEDLDDYSEAVRKEPQRNTGLVILACLLSVGIVAVVLWWLVRYGGLL